MKTIATLAALAVLLVARAAHAQWQQMPDRSLRRSSDGTPDLTAPAPKRDGRTDLSGVWLPDGVPLPPDVHTVEGDLQFPLHMINFAAELKPEDVQMQPWAAELLKKRMEDSGGLDPAAHCKPMGLPFANTAPLPYKIVETPGLVLVLYEGDTVFRQIFLDGRKPVEDPVPRIMGYSTGKWQGDTLVVDSVGFSPGFIDAMGHPFSDQLHLVERIRRPAAGRLEIEMTIDDPGAYLEPLTYTVKSSLLPDTDLLEYFCAENEKDAEHYR